MSEPRDTGLAERAGRPSRADARRTRRSFGALADPVRWRTVELLAQGERCVCDLEAEIGAAQSRLSYHLGVLRDAGLVRARREGRWVHYSLDPGALERLAAELAGVVGQWRAVGSTRPGRHCD